MSNIKLIFCLIFISSINSTFSQKKINYADEFGKTLNKKEFKELKKENKSYLIDKIEIIRYSFYSKSISKKLYNDIKNLLIEKSNQEIPKNNIIVINAGIMTGNCNIQNMQSYDDYINKIKTYQNISYFEVKSHESKKFNNQLVDDERIIFDNFFPYYKWKTKKRNKCGGTLILYPNYIIQRLAGDGTSFNLFSILSKKAPRN